MYNTGRSKYSYDYRHVICKTLRDFDVVPAIRVCSCRRFVFVFPAGNSGISAQYVFNFLSLFWSLRAILITTVLIAQNVAKALINDS